MASSNMEGSNLVKTEDEQKILLLHTVSKKVIEMTTESHLPIYEPDREGHILHETQLTLVHSGGRKSGKV